ncbi:hypothetical protein NSB04_00880 [Blautia pseudococcoides]|nr:hypothetical protein [Blautia pseudococcoides]
MIAREVKKKRMRWVQGLVLAPVVQGKTVKYCQNGDWKETGEVVRVLALTDETIMFETARCRYCIEFLSRKSEALAAVA